MRRTMHLILILCLVLTGVGLGAARGTAMLAGKVVICTGQGIVMVDQPGGPDRPHLCPDMALSLLAGTPVLPPDVGAGWTDARPVAMRPVRQTDGRDAPRPAARGPPGRAVASADPA